MIPTSVHKIPIIVLTKYNFLTTYHVSIFYRLRFLSNSIRKIHQSVGFINQKLSSNLGVGWIQPNKSREAFVVKLVKAQGLRILL